MPTLRLHDPVLLAWLGLLSLLLGGFIALLSTLSSAAIGAMSSLMGNLTLFSIIMAFLLVGARKRVPVYECFIEGAKEGFDIARNLLPYLVAMLCAIGVLRASGALDVTLEAIRWAIGSASGGERGGT